MALFGMYLLDILADLVRGMQGLQPFSVFRYYGSAIENGIDRGGFAGVTAFAVLFMILAVLLFRRRDIYT